MNWSKFKFNCRLLAAQLSTGKDRYQAKQAMREAESQFLLDRGKLGTLPQFLLDRIYEIKDDVKLAKAASLYSQLNLQSTTFDANLRKKYRNFQIYLSWLLFVFIGVGGLYRSHLLPTFDQVFAELEMSLSAALMEMDIIWFSGIICLGSALALTFYLNRFIKKVDDYIISPPRSIVYRFLIPRKLRQQVNYLHQLILAPATEGNDSMKRMLIWLDSNEMNVAEELNAIIVEQKGLLETYIDKRMGWFIALVYVVIIFLIYQLLNVMYVPLFRMGAIV